MARGFSRILAPFGALLLALGAGVAQAQDNPVRYAYIQEENLDEATAEAVRAQITEERDRLLLRLQANAPDQAQATLTTSVSELAGRMIANAMGRLLILMPNGNPVIAGIDGQTLEDGRRQLVLVNLSNWIAKGRKLGAEDLETFALLPDEEMRQPGGSAFQLDGVNYYAAVVDSRFEFHRKP